MCNLFHYTGVMSSSVQECPYSLPHEEGGINGPHSVARPHRSHGERRHRSIQGAVGLRLTFSYTKEKLLMKLRYCLTRNCTLRIC